VDTIHALVAAARARLRDAGIPGDEAELDARLLAEHALGWTTERYFADSRAAAPPEFEAAFAALVARRAAREPFAYIVGREEFWGLEFEVTPAVLIPRPETELLVELATGRCPPKTRVTIADVCTGSGCVAIAMAHERPDVSVRATDISNAALEVARRNASRHGVAARIDFSRADLLDGPDDLAGPFDLIVANPPYVAERDRSTLQPEVVDHEPGIALFAGSDGLDAIHRLLPEAAARLRSGGTLLFEFGFGQDEAVERLISSAAGLRMIELRRDLAGIPRVAVVERE
jgi:release factor glutamine methyltransferase